MIEALALIGLLAVIVIFFLKVYAVAHIMNPIYESLHIVTTLIVGIFGWSFIYVATLMAFVSKETTVIAGGATTYTGTFQTNAYSTLTILLNMGSALFEIIIFLAVIELVFILGRDTGRKMRGREKAER